MKSNFVKFLLFGLILSLMPLTLMAQVTPTPWFSLVRGYVYFNGEPAPPGTIIDAYDPDGVRCGTFKVTVDSTFGYLYVYGDDPYTPGVDEGARAGDYITFKVNSHNTTSVVVDSGSVIWQDKSKTILKLYAEAIVDFELLDFDNVKFGNANDTVWFDIGVKNIGTGLDYYNISSSSASSWTTINTAGNIYAQTGETVYLNCGVVIPSFSSIILDTISISITSPLAGKTVNAKAYVVQEGGSGLIDYQILTAPGDTTGLPGEAISMYVRLRNIGDRNDSYSINTSSASGWKIVKDPIISLRPTQTGNINFTVNIPSDFKTLVDTINYSVYSHLDPSLRYDDQIIITIDTGQFSTIMTIVDAPTSQYVSPGETFRISIGVKNDGNTSDIYTITSSSLLGWNTVDQDDIYNPSGNVEYVYFDVDVPLHINTLYDSVTYTISSLIDPSQTYTGIVELISTSDIVVKMKVVEPAVNKGGFPGDTVSFPIRVRNDGNSTDIYQVVSASTKGWITIDDNNVYNSPGNITEVKFKVVVPTDAMEEYDVIDYVVSSKVDPSKSYSGTVVLKSSHNSIYILSTVQEPDDQYGLPGTTARFTLKVRNDGNADDLYGFKANSREGWNTTVSDSLPNPVGTLMKAYFDVSIPSNGDGITDQIFFRLFSYNDSTQFVEGYVQLYVSSTESNVAITPVIFPGNKSGFPGDTITFTMGIANTGNSTDLYNLSTKSSLNWPLINPPNLLISPNDTQLISFNVVIPATAGNAEDIISFNLSSLIDFSQSYKGNVKLTSSRLPFVALEIVEFPKNQSGVPGTTSRFSIMVRNNGNMNDMYGLTVTSTEGWMITAVDSVENSPGNTVKLTFDVVIPGEVINVVDIIQYKVFSYVDNNKYYQGSVMLSVLTTDVEDDKDNLLPDEFAVMQNYPNPFNPITTIKFALPERSKVTMQIFNILGQMVENKDLGSVPAGYHEISFDGSNKASGVYFYRILTDYGDISKKMVLIK